ncbi:MAG TPA: chromate transporter [Pseudolabrys sp.]|nr:chromate transporter [Pseudolabrys sp.]
MKDDTTLALLLVFVPFSLVSIGGGTSVLAGIHHQAVDLHHWVSAREFVDLFAIARAAPGPGSMLTTLIGWHIAGWWGAVVATLALFLPSSMVCYGVALMWRRHRGKRWHTALEQGLAPIGIGLVLAGAMTVLQIGHGGPMAWAVAFGSAGLMSWQPRLHPLLIFALGGGVFVAARMFGLVQPA